MNLKKIIDILVFSLTILVSAQIYAQQSNESYLNVLSDPNGATVQLRGEYSLILTAPASIRQELDGEYKVMAFKRGYERWNSTVWFKQGSPDQLAIKLNPKTRFKAGLRSLLVPGWGQFYCEDKTKSLIMGISTLGAVIVFVIADNNYSSKYDDYRWSRAQLDNSSNIEDWKKYSQLVDETQRKAYDAENLRRAALGIAVGAWAYNVLDAILFFPYGEEHSFADRSKVTFELCQGAPRIVFTEKF